MNKIQRQILVCALMLILITSACGTTESPTPVGTILPSEPTLYPAPGVTDTATVTITSVPPTPLIPLTGENVVALQCQFCVDDEAHAVLIFPDFAFFDVDVSSPVSCLTASVVNGQRILICRGAPQTSFNLNICSDASTCLQFPVDLQECLPVEAGTPLATSTLSTPIFLNPINTLESNDDPDATPTVGTTQPPVPTPTTVSPTSEPEPTVYP